MVSREALAVVAVRQSRLSYHEEQSLEKESEMGPTNSLDLVVGGYLEGFLEHDIS